MEWDQGHLLLGSLKVDSAAIYTIFSMKEAKYEINRYL